MKIKFNSLNKNKVLIFDQNGENILSRAVLDSLNYTVLPVRGESVFISLRIVVNSIKNLFKVILFLLRIKKINISYLISLGYYLSCIEYVAPKVVIANIDNAGLFYHLNKLYNKAEFLAIQNGMRVPDDIKRSTLTNDIFQFFCFGLYEKELYSKCGHKTTNFKPIGSLRGGYYKYCLSEKPEICYDICIVSQFREDIVFGNKYPSDKAGYARLNKYLAMFLKDKNIKKVCVACRFNNDLEVDYFKQFYDHAEIVKNNREELLTYKCMDKSNVIIAGFSTAAIEAFGWGKKVLLYNYTGDNNYSFPLPDICMIEGNDEYRFFEEKLNNLLTMNYDYYKKINSKYFKYFMNYDPQNPPNEIIRRKILNIINE